MSCQNALLPSASSQSSVLPHQNQRDQFENLAIVNKLNQAKFSVFLAFSPTYNKHYALKIFPYVRSKVNPYYLNEARFSTLKHPNVTSIVHSELGKTISVGGQQKKISYTVMELAPNGDFFDLLLTRKTFLDEKLARTYFHQLIKGLEYLHSKGIAHLDIKPENLLIGEDFQLKICDFDHSVIDGEANISSKGTLFYRAPEIIEGTCKNFAAADIYSAGIVMFLFLCGGVLPHAEHNKFEGSDLLDLLENDNETFWEKHCEIQRRSSTFFSEEFKDLFNSMTQPNPEERPQLMDIKNSEWFKGSIYTDEELISVMVKKFSN